jgi:hypothetical protein
MIKYIIWKLKTSKCSSVIAFENLSIIVSLCGFQNIWSFSVFVTMSISSWILFTLITCWLAINEEMSLKSIISFLLNQISCIPLSQVKLSNRVQRCMNWKDLFPVEKIVSVFHRKFSSTQIPDQWSVQPKLEYSVWKTGVSGFRHRTCPTFLTRF